MPLSLTVFALVVLAVARATRLVTTDTLTAPLRDKLGERALAAYRRDQAKAQAKKTMHGHDDPSDGDSGADHPAEADTVRSPGERGLFALVVCPWCIGFWLSLLAYVLIYWIGQWPSTVGQWGMAGVVVAATAWLVGALNTRFAR